MGLNGGGLGHLTGQVTHGTFTKHQQFTGICLPFVGISPADVEQQCFGLANTFGKFAIPFGLSGLLLQGRDLAIKRHQNVFKTFHILFGIFKPKLGLVAARMKAGDPGGFFQNKPALAWLRPDQGPDLALRHHGV